ncbi:hypothetical protein HDU84_004906 [Entophlyctis sp. JEL0112]|nr:hypothetical protein HDU84_004906 [Entophlyctis sp. JEL0112]
MVRWALRAHVCRSDRVVLMHLLHPVGGSAPVRTFTRDGNVSKESRDREVREMMASRELLRRFLDLFSAHGVEARGYGVSVSGESAREALDKEVGDQFAAVYQFADAWLQVRRLQADEVIEVQPSSPPVPAPTPAPAPAPTQARAPATTALATSAAAPVRLQSGASSGDQQKRVKGVADGEATVTRDEDGEEDDSEEEDEVEQQQVVPVPAVRAIRVGQRRVLY